MKGKLPAVWNRAFLISSKVQVLSSPEAPHSHFPSSQLPHVTVSWPHRDLALILWTGGRSACRPRSWIFQASVSSCVRREEL